MELDVKTKCIEESKTQLSIVEELGITSSYISRIVNSKEKIVSKTFLRMMQSLGYNDVSRSFAPKLAVDEDPVCGSGHCHIIPYWADTLGKEELVAYQASKRGGMLYCRRAGDKIFIAGRATLYSVDELFVDEERKTL